MKRHEFSLPVILFLMAGAVVASGGSPAASESRPVRDFSKWEKDIAAFEALDRRSPPRPGGVLFIGSSSIRLWNLDESFPKLGAVNRGFGGSHLEDCVHFTPRILIPHQPETVVLYAGDNDIADNKSAETVVADYRAFVKGVHATLPGARIIYIPIKPSLARWEIWPKMKKANDAIAAIAAGEPTLLYADIVPPMLGEDGRPRGDLFLKDGLHLNAKGYAAWAEVVAPLLESSAISGAGRSKKTD